MSFGPVLTDLILKGIKTAKLFVEPLGLYPFRVLTDLILKGIKTVSVFICIKSLVVGSN